MPTLLGRTPVLEEGQEMRLQMSCGKSATSQLLTENLVDDMNQYGGTTSYSYVTSDATKNVCGAKKY
jgi:hypothetical protein